MVSRQGEHKLEDRPANVLGDENRCPQPWSWCLSVLVADNAANRARETVQLSVWFWPVWAEGSREKSGAEWINFWNMLNLRSCSTPRWNYPELRRKGWAYVRDLGASKALRRAECKQEAGESSQSVCVSVCVRVYTQFHTHAHTATPAAGEIRWDSFLPKLFKFGNILFFVKEFTKLSENIRAWKVIRHTLFEPLYNLRGWVRLTCHITPNQHQSVWEPRYLDSQFQVLRKSIEEENMQTLTVQLKSPE